jgi:hypothetical protein
MPPELHLGKYYRYLWEEMNLLVVIGHFSEVAVSRRLYEERYGIAPISESVDGTLVRLMGASALAAVSLSDRESWGWTVTFGNAPVGYFVGLEPEGMICGRVKAAEPDRNIAYVQRQKQSAPMTESFFEPVSADPAEMVTQYFTQTVQIETRVLLEEEGFGVLVQSLPGGRFETVAELTHNEFMSFIKKKIDEGAFKPVGEVLIFYECRCDDEMVLNMVTSLPEAQSREVWGEEDATLTIECPRCGRSYEIQRPIH